MVRGVWDFLQQFNACSAYEDEGFGQALTLRSPGKVLDVHQIPKGIIVSSAAPRHHTGSAECLSA